MTTKFNIFLNVSEYNKNDQSFFCEINQFLNSKLNSDIFEKYYSFSFSEWSQYTNYKVSQNGLYLVKCEFDLSNNNIDLIDWELCE